jgi:hypothetical protein
VPALSDSLAPFDHALRGALHGGHGVLRVGLNGLHQRRDLARGVGGAFGQPLHFFGHHREAPARFTGRRGLDGGVQGQHVGLFGNVGNQFGDFADLLRRLAQPLDALGGFLDLVADGVHAADGVLHRLQARLGGLSDWRATWADSCAWPDTALIRSHVEHRLAGFADLAQLLGRGGQQLGGGAFHLRRRLRHLGGRVLHVAHQLAQFFHRVVHRVGDGAGDVLGHGGFLRQVAFGHRLQFVHQAKNGGLVGVVDALGFLLLALGFEALRFGHFLALAAVLQLHVGQADGAGDGEQRRPATGRAGDRARPVCADSLPCRSSSAGAAARCRQ